MLPAIEVSTSKMFGVGNIFAGLNRYPVALEYKSTPPSESDQSETDCRRVNISRKRATAEVVEKKKKKTPIVKRSETKRRKLSTKKFSPDIFQ